MFICITFYFSGKFSEIPAMGAIRARVQVRYYCVSCVKYNQSLFTQRNIYTNGGLWGPSPWAPKFNIKCNEENLKTILLRTSDGNAIIFSILITEIDSFQSNSK
jgi:hypothetical protein